MQTPMPLFGNIQIKVLVYFKKNKKIEKRRKNVTKNPKKLYILFLDKLVI